MSTPAPRSEPAPAQFSDRYRRYVLGLLLVVYVFNFIDRQILSILAEDIKKDIPFTDATYGLLTGPVFAILYTFVGISVTSASAVLFRHPIWNPITLIGAFHQPLVALVAMIAILVATLNVNIGANVVSPSNDFSNLYPRLISFRTGGMITGLLGIAMCPWKLLATPDAYIFGWLVGYSGLLGPVAGIMVADYFLIRKTELDVNSLYHRDGVYHYSRGFNPRAIAALILGVAIALVGRFVPSLHFLYDYAWFVGFFAAGISYAAMMRMAAHASYSDGEQETV